MQRSYVPTISDQLKPLSVSSTLYLRSRGIFMRNFLVINLGDAQADTISTAERNKHSKQCP